MDKALISSGSVKNTITEYFFILVKDSSLESDKHPEVFVAIFQ